MDPLDLESAASSFRGAVVAIGTFDGVHRAHRALVDAARREARRLGTEVLALTFEPHPKEVLLRRPPPRLTGIREKTRRLVAAGAGAVCCLDFDSGLSGMEQEDFVDRILFERLGAAGLAIGYNFSFGRGGRGRPEDLVRLAGGRGVPVRVLEALDLEGIPVSSTGIRELIACGDVEAAAERLGEPHRLTGTVVPGDGRGRGLGFPTANLGLLPRNLLVPRRGVYAGRAHLEGRDPIPALVNVGVNPTFLPGDDPVAERVEVHCLDLPDRDLYGESLAIELAERVRDEVRFEGADRLREQLVRDVAWLRSRLAEGAFS